MNRCKYLTLLFGLVVFIVSCKSIKSSTHRPIQTVILNKGVSGNTSTDLIKRLDIDLLNENPDLVILMVGTNDMLNSKKFVSYENYGKNLDKIVKQIKSINAQVLMMSPPTVDSVYLYMRHDKNAFIETPNVKLQKAKEIVEQIAMENHVLFLDVNSIFKAMGLPLHNEDDYVRNKKNSNVEDGVHLTAFGYKFLAENVYSYLESQNLMNTYSNIICFGDSLTKGSGAKGAGSITGKNYPSVLYALFNN